MPAHLLHSKIVLEKRLGVAQLCLLLAVLVFMGLTRGSRAEALIDHGSSRLNRSVREWGGRHFRLSGSWAGRFKGKNLEIRTSRRNSPSSSRSTSRTRTPQTSTRPKPISAKSYPPQPHSRSQSKQMFRCLHAQLMLINSIQMVMIKFISHQLVPVQKCPSTQST